jgi:alginate biosynthesis protein AlgK
MRVARGLAACALLAAFACAALPPEPDLPDLRRGQKAAAAGDIAGAEHDLVPLAQMGYPAAQVALAGLYGQSEDPETLAKAVKWYRIAAQQDPAVMVPLARVLLELDQPATFAEAEKFLRTADRKGDKRALAALLEFYTDHPERDARGETAALVARAEKQKGSETEAALIRWYRHNVADERAARALAQRCARAKERVPECYVDLARHYRSHNDERALAALAAEAPKRHAGGALPAPLLERMAWSLVSEGVAGEPRPDLAYPLLKRMMQSSPTALVRVARLQVEYPHLDPDSNPEQLLQAALAQGSTEAALALGRLYMNGTRVVADPQKAERYLLDAAATQPAAHYFLGRLYKRGELGTAEPLRAAEHLLTAARGGYARADYLLAQLFSDNRGVKPNRVNAAVFASIAAGNGVAEAAPLLATLRAGLSAPDRRRAEALEQEERVERARAATPQQQTAAAPGVSP